MLAELYDEKDEYALCNKYYKKERNVYENCEWIERDEID